VIDDGKAGLAGEGAGTWIMPAWWGAKLIQCQTRDPEDQIGHDCRDAGTRGRLLVQQYMFREDGQRGAAGERGGLGTKIDERLTADLSSKKGNR